MNLAARINQYLKAKGSPMAGLGRVFVNAGRQHGIDPLLIVAIAGAESSFGKQARGYNPFGWGPGHQFQSWQQAIDTVAHGLRVGYANEGRKTIAAIGAKWAPEGATNDPSGLNNNWVNNVTTFYRELGGRGINAGGASVPPSAAGAAPASAPAPAAPDFTGAAFQNLSDISAGVVSPRRQLGNIIAAGVQASQQQVPGVEPSPVPPLKPPRRGKVAELLIEGVGGPTHSTGPHIHFASTDAQTMLAAIRYAQSLGLHVGENPYVGGVDFGVHAPHSYHKRFFPGRYNGRQLGQAIDVTGAEAAKQRFYQWAKGLK